MYWYYECLEEVKKKIDSAIEKNDLPYLEALTLEGYKTSIETLLRDLYIGQMVFKWNGRVDLEKLEETRKKYKRVKEELKRILKEDVIFEKTDKVFESPIVAISDDTEKVKEIVEDLLRP